MTGRPKAKSTKPRKESQSKGRKSGSQATPGELATCDAVGFEPDLEQARKLVLELLAVPGRSCQEAQVSQAIVDCLRDAGATKDSIETDAVHRRTPTRGETGNLVLNLSGTRSGPRRMFSAHLDTVPVCVGARPVVRGRTVVSRDADTGLGADDRAGCAVILTAAREILQRRLPHPPLTFCWFVQEEIGLQGSRQVKKSLLKKPRMAFNWDGGSCDKLTVGATGGSRMAIEIRGLASHAGGAPEQGVSAIAIAALAIADLQRNGWHGLVQKGRRRGTSNVGVIRGGEATNVVTDLVVIRAEARSHDPVFRARIVREIQRAFLRAARQVRSSTGKRGAVEIGVRHDYESFLLPSDDPSVLEAESSLMSIGRNPVRAVANGGVDANWTTRHGIPTVTIGCGQRNVHTVNESLELDEFEAACRVALRLATASDDPDAQP